MATTNPTPQRHTAIAQIGNTPFYDHDRIVAFLTLACEHYEHSAPAVWRYLDTLYQRLEDGGNDVNLKELRAIRMLYQDGEWEHPNVAQNRIYKLMSELGMDTTGMIDF